MLKAFDLHKDYITNDQKLQVLRGVDFNIEHGSYTVVMGESGAGKSTLLHILGFLDRANQGHVEFAGYNSSKLNEATETSLRLTRIGYLFQRHHLLNDFSSAENVALPKIANGESYEQAIEHSIKLLDNLGMKERSESFPAQLSGGESQRVALARALVNNPSLLIADEPTGNLDFHNTERLMDYIDHLRDKFNLTILMATHDRRVARRADKIYVIENGVLIDG